MGLKLEDLNLKEPEIYTKSDYQNTYTIKSKNIMIVNAENSVSSPTL
jgi:hypothetical protein